MAVPVVVYRAFGSRGAGGGETEDDLSRGDHPALAICLPAAIFYLGLVLERTMAYLIFFPKQKKKKKAKAETDIPMQKVG